MTLSLSQMYGTLSLNLMGQEPLELSHSYGRHARERDEPKDSNPYPAGSTHYTAWESGWEFEDFVILHES